MHVEVTHDTLDIVTSWGQIAEGILIAAAGIIAVWLSGAVLGGILIAAIVTTAFVTHVALHDA